MTILQSAWDSYAKQVLPADAPDVQRIECRRAFYAGAQSLFWGIMSMLDPGIEPTEADLSKMDALHRELVSFSRDVDEGRA